MIEAAFNELTAVPYCTTDNEVESRLATFADVLNELTKLGVKNVRYEDSFADISLKENYSLADYCKKCSTSDQRNRRDLLYSKMRRPYLTEDKENLVYKYSDCKYLHSDGTQKDCLGLYIAYVTDSFTVGFDQSGCEDKCPEICKLQIVQNDGTIAEHTVCCLTRPEHINLDEFVKLMARQDDLVVPKYIGDGKKIHLPSHHGLAECKQHAQQLIGCEYIKEVLNSIDFNPSEKQYIHTVRNNNIIEIRLTWTKEGYGLCVSTTATNMAQNYWIARFLEEKYSK